MLIIPASLFGQEITVTGRITDEIGQGIPGVNVVVKGTTNGTATDLEGRYSIRLDPASEKVLFISSIGYTSIEEPVGQRAVVDVQLAGDITQLQEIVVTGYSTIMKKDIASSISVVDVNDMKKVASSNFAEQLQGKVAGVQIATSNDPGSFQYVRVRGIGTINNNEPLYVVDGVPVQNETNMNFLNPNDIESMQVLKDAAAASIYGARAANGVIVITTKKGRGTSKLQFDIYTGIQDPQNLPEMANPTELLEIRRNLRTGAGQKFQSQFYIEKEPGNWQLPDFMVNNLGYAEGDDDVDPSRYVLNTTNPELYADNHPIARVNKEGTNWFEEMLQPASLTSAQLTASGGDEKGSHYFSMSYFEHNGILIKNKWRRFQTRLNSDFSVGKNLRLGENINISFQTRAAQPYDFDIQKIYYDPNVPVYDINGYWATSKEFANPVADQTRWADGRDGLNLRLTGNAFLEYDFLKDFTFKTNIGLDYNHVPTSTYLYTAPETSRANQYNSLSKNWSTQRNWVMSSTLNFNRSAGDHTVYALAGAEVRNTFWEGFKASGTGLRFGDDPNFRELSNAQSGTATMESGRSNSRMVSAFLNANYTFRDRYILLATVRTDGSSRFVNDKFGFFPGFSAAWRISQESFMSAVDFLTELKLRASWGKLGNNEVVGGDYPGVTTYGASLAFSSYPINNGYNSVTQGFAQVATGNPDLKWETSTVVNLAVDATLARNLDLTFEWYSRKTEDMIYGVLEPLESGITLPVNRNVGSMINKGIDVQLNYRGNTFSQKLSYTVGLTGTHYTNKVLQLADDNSIVGGPQFIIRTEAGYPVSQLYGFIAEGLWQSQEQIDSVLSTSVGDARPGRMKFRDINEDGKIDDSDRTMIGNPIPKFILGLNTTLNYKNFDLTAYFSGVFGKKVYNFQRGSSDFAIKPEAGIASMSSKRMLYEAGRSLPVLDITDGYSGMNSSYWVEDASFLRLRNVILGYTLSKELVAKAGLSNVRIYVQAQNVFTWTKYSGMDPDVTIANMYNGNEARRDLVTGVDFGRYPSSRQFIVGLNLGF
jgi:TonB-linked SusC/RagA family outer membrane protein